MDRLKLLRLLVEDDHFQAVAGCFPPTEKGKVKHGAGWWAEYYDILDVPRAEFLKALERLAKDGDQLLAKTAKIEFWLVRKES